MNVLEKILEEIEEKTVLVATSKEHYNQPQNGKYVEEVITIKDAENIIRSHMDGATFSNHDDNWIPVEERLPEEKTEVLCCFENGTVQSLWQNWKNDGLGDYLDDDLMPTELIAWQPLPGPYKPKEKDDE